MGRYTFTLSTHDCVPRLYAFLAFASVFLGSLYSSAWIFPVMTSTVLYHETAGRNKLT